MVAVVTCAVFHSYLYSTCSISAIYIYKTSRKKNGNPDVHRVKNAMPCYDVRYFRVLCAAVKTRNTFTAEQIKDLSYLNVLNAGNVISRENPCPALACWDVDEPDTESSNEEEEDAGLVSAASESKGEDHAAA